MFRVLLDYLIQYQERTNRIKRRFTRCPASSIFITDETTRPSETSLREFCRNSGLDARREVGSMFETFANTHTISLRVPHIRCIGINRHILLSWAAPSKWGSTSGYEAASNLRSHLRVTCPDGVSRRPYSWYFMSVRRRWCVIASLTVRRCTTRGSQDPQGSRFVKCLKASSLDFQVFLRADVAETAKSINAIRSSMCA